MPAAQMGADLGERDRAEMPEIDADVDLTRERREATVAVAVQVDGPAADPVPGAQGVVAEDQPHPFGLDLGVVLDARPAGKVGGRRTVVVADDQMLGAGECVQEGGDAGRGLAHREVAEVPDLVVRADRLVPAATIAPSISAVVANGRLNSPRAPPWPKW